MQNIYALDLVGLFARRFLKFIVTISFGCHGNQISSWNEIL
jgi:hypothetical protein